MATAIVTGSAGLIGSEAVRFLCGQGFHVVGLDNDMRKMFFGEGASTAWKRQELEREFSEYTHHDVDIRDVAGVAAIFARYASDIELIIHAAAQPSHEWAAKDPSTDFSVNANGTLILLEQTRSHCPGAVFIFTSSNKVYGDSPNRLPLRELSSRWEVDELHAYFEFGIDEGMSTDFSMHSLFGVSKLAADALVQEYGRYYGIATGCFRGGCLTGPAHSGAELHGFLSYLMKCAVSGNAYTINGYKGKQVRDNIHSRDLISMFWHFFQNPRPAEVYNAGGGRQNSCSVREAISICEKISGNPLATQYRDENRAGDHIWYISDTRKFESHYPDWKREYSLQRCLQEIFDSLAERRQLPSKGAPSKGAEAKAPTE